MRDPDGYEVAVPCDCAQGEHRQRTLLIFRDGCQSSGRPRRHVGELLRAGYTLLLHEEMAVSAADAEWANGQLAAGRPLRELLGELRARRDAG